MELELIRDAARSLKEAEDVNFYQFNQELDDLDGTWAHVLIAIVHRGFIHISYGTCFLDKVHANGQFHTHGWSPLGSLRI